MLLFWLCCSWIAGLLLGSALALPPLYTLAAAGILVLVAWLTRHNLEQRITALLCVFLLLGLSRSSHYSLTRPDAANPAVLLHYTGSQAIEVEAVITREPEISEQNAHLVLAAQAARLTGEPAFHPVQGQLLVYAPLYPKYDYGDLVRISGKLEAAPIFDDFNYRDYLADQEIYALAYHPRLQRIDHFAAGPAPSDWDRLQTVSYASLLHLKASLQRFIGQAIPEPQASLLAGLLLGVKTDLDPQLQNALTRTGLTHIVVISGYNMVIIAAFLQNISRRVLKLSPARSYQIAIAGICFFILLTGISASALRAGIMVALGFMAPLFGRRGHPLIALAFSAAILLAWNPAYLRDIGFQLSFAATCGMLVILPQLQPLVDRAIQRLGSLLARPLQVLGADLAVTVSAVLLTEPIIGYHFHTLALISPLANLLILPLVPAAMLTGFCFVLLAPGAMVWSLLSSVAEIPALITWAVLWIMSETVHWLAAFPAASIGLPPFSTQFLYAYYLVLALLFLPLPAGRSLPRILYDLFAGRTKIPGAGDTIMNSRASR